MAGRKNDKKVPIKGIGQKARGPSRNSKESKNSQPDRDGLTVVGIGASAGGLWALQSFFDSLPPDTGMAFVVVTHMHPEHESHLADLLQVHTVMQVNQVQGIMPVQGNHVYVMPPNRQVLITNSHLDLGNFEEPRGKRTPIDGFFRSLAAAHQDAIGIILSGTGTDGSVGIKDIKENGGLILVQSPEEAEYDGMPRAAISTGLADVVQPVSLLAGKLVEYSRQIPNLPLKPEHLSDEQQDVIDRIIGHVHARTGNDFGQYKRSTILRRIQRRMQLNNILTLDAYLEYLREHGAEANAIVSDILIGVTNFFRDRASWDALAASAIPAIFENKNSEAAIRVWSIGCATGEEAYSLAMLLIEHAAALEKHYDIRVFASDLSDVALSHAREGIYPTAIEADVPLERLERFFTLNGNHYRVKRELRDMVIFTNHNILRDPPFSHIDLIVCRNLLIYLRREVQDTLFEIFHYSLNPGAYLFLGNSESGDAAADMFNQVDKSHRIYRSRPSRDEQFHLPILPQITGASRWKEPAHFWPVPESTKTSRASYLLQEHEAALEDYSPPSMIIDEQYNLLHVSETAGRFLLQPMGEPTRELLKLVRPELQSELRMVAFQAFEQDRACVTNPVWVDFNGSPRRVTIFVRPVEAAEKETEKKALVVFLEDEVSESSREADTPRDNAVQDTDAMIAKLQAEDRRLREQYQAMAEEYNSSNEEMKAANEELQSINEEYRSTTEELETSREELQSVNEELQTANNELKSKLDEIMQANVDLENLMATSEIATIFLDRKFRIKRFNSGMDKILGLLASDQGRPVANFANKLGYDNLPADANTVLENHSTLEREIEDKTGVWYLMRIRPYRTINEKIDGVVITFMDISDLKEAQRALQEMNESLQGRVEERTQALDQINRGLTAANNMFSTLLIPIPSPQRSTGSRIGPF